MTQTDIFIIAGEASGDILGAEILKNITKIDPNIKIKGIGGEEMEKFFFFKSLFNINDISVMGFFEVIKNIFKIKKRIKQTIKEILETKPKIVLTIDSPSFNTRIIKKVKKYLPTTKFIHYVAPQVWAWKEYRAKYFAKIFDVLLCLFPFEKKYFSKYKLKCFTIGHPGINYINGNKNNFLKTYNIENNSTILSFLPGTRKQTLTKLLPIYEKVISKLKSKYTNLKILIPTTYYLKNLIKEKTKNWSILPIIITGKQNRYDSLVSSNIAIAISGTSILELAILKVPTIVVYKTSFITYLLAKLFIKIKYLSLPNIIMNKKIVPELIQTNCKAETIIQNIDLFLQDKNFIIEYKNNCELFLKTLTNNTKENPSFKASKIILKYLTKY